MKSEKGLFQSNALFPRFICEYLTMKSQSLNLFLRIRIKTEAYGAKMEVNER